MEKTNFNILFFLVLLTSLCDSQDYSDYYDTNYYDENYDYYEHQNLLAPAPIPILPQTPPSLPQPPAPSPAPPAPPPPPPKTGNYLHICWLVSIVMNLEKKDTYNRK